MRDECVAMYGPVVDGAPQWRIDREGAYWVLRFESGGVPLSFMDPRDALTWARSWADEVAERRGG